jgi:hypothetical protein
VASFRNERGGAAMLDEIGPAHDERNKVLQATIEKQETMSKSIDAKLEELKQLTELLKSAITK